MITSYATGLGITAKTFETDGSHAGDREVVG
jgi:hypothetical protein